MKESNNKGNLLYKRTRHSTEHLNSKQYGIRISIYEIEENSKSAKRS